MVIEIIFTNINDFIYTKNKTLVPQVFEVTSLGFQL